jgi:hypothetical protein
MSEVHSERFPRVPRFPETARGNAQFVQWLLAGEGHKVRLDRRRVRYPPNDYAHRPVLVQYTSRQSATSATRQHDSNAYARRGPTVLWIPPNLPRQVAAEYRFAGSVGVG